MFYAISIQHYFLLFSQKAVRHIYLTDTKHCTHANMYGSDIYNLEINQCGTLVSFEDSLESSLGQSCSTYTLYYIYLKICKATVLR